MSCCSWQTYCLTCYISAMPCLWSVLATRKRVTTRRRPIHRVIPIMRDFSSGGNSLAKWTFPHRQTFPTKAGIFPEKDYLQQYSCWELSSVPSITIVLSKLGWFNPYWPDRSDLIQNKFEPSRIVRIFSSSGKVNSRLQNLACGLDAPLSRFRISFDIIIFLHLF
jgi:hypothetical protein